MASPSPVPARAVLRAISEVRRRGQSRLVDQLDQDEPELSEYVLEALSAIHHDLLALGGPARLSQTLYREIQELVLIVITAMRHAHLEPADDTDTDAGANDEAAPDSPS